MQLSDLTMKKQILFGQIWKRLKIIVVDLNHYELILSKMSNFVNLFEITQNEEEEKSCLIYVFLFLDTRSITKVGIFLQASICNSIIAFGGAQKLIIH